MYTYTIVYLKRGIFTRKIWVSALASSYTVVLLEAFDLCFFGTRRGILGRARSSALLWPNGRLRGFSTIARTFPYEHMVPPSKGKMVSIVSKHFRIFRILVMSHEALGSGCIEDSKNDLSIHMMVSQTWKKCDGPPRWGRKNLGKSKHPFIFVMFHHHKKQLHVVGPEKGFFKVLLGQKIPAWESPTKMSDF